MTIMPTGPAAEAITERLNSEGLAFLGTRDLEAARRIFRRALALSPGYVAAHGNLANLDAQDERLASALVGYRRALTMAPRLAGLHMMLGTALLRAGKYDAGERSLAVALDLNPGYPKAYFNLGTHKLQQRRPVEAEEDFRRAIEGDPTSDLALAGLGRVLSERSRSREALAVTRRSIILAPSSVESLSAFSQVVIATGDVTTAIRALRRALTVAFNPFTVKGLMSYLHYDPEAESEELFRLHQRWGALQSEPDKRPLGNTPDPGRRLRVGYLSADLYDHPVGRTVIGLIERHDPDRIVAYVYPGHDRNDQVSERIRTTARAVRSTVGLDDHSVAEQIRADGIDILVVLAGHTLFNRISVAALKPAPIQASLYDLATSGLGAMDYFLGDDSLNPPDGEERFVENVICLPCFYLQRPLEDVPSPLRPDGLVVFGSSGNPSKLNQRVIRLWSRILQAVPNARLALKYHSSFSDPDLVNEFRHRFAAFDIDPSRIDFDGRRTDNYTHLAAVGGFDIALDPFPFNGCTTTFEALWMGVPVVTVVGRRAVGRMSTAILRQAGLDELVASSEDDYVNAAVQLAHDPSRRNKYRRELRARLMASPLLDAGAYARAVENAYREMWLRWCGDQRGGAGF